MLLRIIVGLFAVAVLCSNPAAAQYLYFSTEAGECITQDLNAVPKDTFFVFLHYPAEQDIIGARFWLENNAYGPEDLISYEPQQGVTIDNGHPLQGIRLSWSPVPMIHHPLLKMVYVDNPPYQDHRFESLVWTRDVMLYKSAGDSLSLDDFYSSLIWGSYSCLSSFVLWEHQDTVNVAINIPAVVTVRGVVRTPESYEGSEVEITDPQGWVTGWTPDSLIATCLLCPWHWITIEVMVEIPEGTSNGALSEMVVTPLCCENDTTSLILRATDTSPARRNSLGGIKALFD